MAFRDVLVAVALLVTASSAFAEDEAQRRAREELEKELKELVGKAPSRVRVEFQPIDDPNFQVEEFELSVDGKVLKAPTPAAISGWMQDGPMPVGVVDVTPGRHKVSARVTYHNTASALVSEEGDHRWKVTGDVGFDVAAGIEVKVIVAPTRDATQADVGKRIKLTFPTKPVMIAKLDDGSMPEPSKLKPTPIDAGPSKEQLAVAAADAKKAAAEAALEAKRVAAEEAKRKADDAARAKQEKLEAARLAQVQAAEEKKRKLEEAKLARVAAAEEKKRKLEEAALAKAQAAEEKRRAAEEASKPAAPVAAERPGITLEDLKALALDQAPDAGAAVAEAVVEVDAGAEVAAAPAVDAGLVATAKAEAPAAPEPEGLPWVIIGGAIAVVLAIIAIAVRRAGRVPELKD